MSYEEQIRFLAETTYKTNAQIADALGCSRRSVRRYVGSWKDRVGKKTGEAVGSIKHKNPARILLFDIETAPLEVYVWSLFKQNYISPENIIKPWSILSWSAKWLFEPHVMSQSVSGEEAINREDNSILPGIWDLLNEANIVIAHNGARFDVRKVNARFIAAGMPPPMSYRVIDTLRVAKNRFDFPSYKLNEINKWLNLSLKIKTEYNLWVRCAHGDENAIREMELYNNNDVLILEELYLTLRSWVKNHPALGLYVDTGKEVCSNCGNTNLDWNGNYYTPAGRFKAFRCGSCGAVGRSRYSDLTKEEKERLLVGVAT